MKSPIFFLALFFLFEISALAQPISESFELRYFSNSPKANGETDFKGETAVFNTEDRVEYLKRYAIAAKEFFNDPNLDTKVVSDDQLTQAMSKLKPQPEPEVRKRIPLKSWKWMGYKPGMEKCEAAEMRVWNDNKAVEIENEQLRFISDDEIIIPIDRQVWRFFIEWKISGNTSETGFSLASDGVPVASLKTKSDEMLIHSKGEEVSHLFKQNTDDSKTLKLEVDLENGRYNVYVDEQLVADFIPLLSNQSVNQLVIHGKKGLVLDDVYGVGYEKAEFTDDTHTRDVPFSINTFIDQDFSLKPNMENWQSLDYDDTHWPVTTLPHPHGGERYAGEDLYMRTTFTPGEFEKAVLNFETLDPDGEIWINGQIVLLQHNRYPGNLDVSKFLIPDEENIIAVKIYPSKVAHTNRHTASDLHTGWFAGRMHVDLTGKRYIKDVFTFTKSLNNNRSANQEFRVRLINEDWEFEEREMKATREFNGSLRIDLFPWYPEESTAPIATHVVPVYLRLMKDEELIFDVPVSEPELWTVERPFLYKVVATLLNDQGLAVDDFVVTTGIRTVTQEGGTFRINGTPSMMNGALLFGYKSPLDKISQWLKAGPEEWLVKEILMIKNMNGNTIRMSIHDQVEGSVNDPRLAEIGDQLGVMFQWTTGTWVRTGSPWLLDFEGLPKYVNLVRNHPSIVMWQPGNHPKFVDFDTEVIYWYEKVYESIYPYDPSRLISPLANNSRLNPRNDEGTLDQNGNSVAPVSIWTAPKITRGDMDHATGYGAEWSTLRRYPYPKDWSGEQGWRVAGYRTDYLNSKDRAYFDFESEESAAQPNWKLRKGKPSYQIKSYELEYDEGSIGRQLTVDEWEASQAWQAFSGFEAYKKKRWLDYDGLAWCTLHGGGNTATYEKPLIDYYGYAKLGFYAVKMAFQHSLAGSHNVDVVYGPEDEIEPVIMNLGNAEKVNLLVTIKKLDGKVMEQKEYRNILMDEGRTSTVLDSFRPKVQEGYFVIHYQIFRNE